MKINTSFITNTSVHICLGNFKIRFATAYKSPNTTLDAFLNTPVDTFIAGDLNCKHLLWKSHSINAFGRILAKVLEDRLDIIISALISPTHYPHNPNHWPDVLDIALIKTEQKSFTTSKTISQTFCQITLP